MNLVEKVRNELKSVYDPELNINVVDLGLIYNIEVTDEGDVKVTMTLTTPGCPLHSSIERGVRYSLEGLEEVRNVEVDLVWEPAWTPDKMTPEGMKILHG
ncbi:metal-sulfur cluster assembly factor [Bacillus sp. EB600]|uniref:metal-sulfur cluster assembly factor n=1 Tax=Bacillus sp. EB600 TaxID=2806345 RepID=UPI00210A12E7|nr:metal-sulfur cluster assembly factor [Bacillus sp. EB600]MCQ6277866.1 metal-sulfur cluster assembly factor [Bacillus sp. EB600]